MARLESQLFSVAVNLKYIAIVLVFVQQRYHNLTVLFYS